MTSFAVQHDPVFGCELWLGHKDKRDGRAMSWRGNKPVVAYRLVYEQRVGPVPDSMVLDHLCRRPDCVAPHHLEVVTKDENERRKNPKHRLRRAQCAKGHDLNEHRIIVPPNGGVVCRACNREARGAGR